MRRSTVHDLVIRGGTVVDGLGHEPVTADVAVDDGRITEIGKVDGPARETIDADGLLVTPGFVDVHTHYDGQATWDSQLGPSCWHGVTTVVMGNCGVGFAPVQPGGEQELIEIMEGVEDIPGTALWEGIEWQWESFPQYLDALERRPRMVDVGTHVPHAAVRAYVMGDRAGTGIATADDLAAMVDIARAGIDAGALGISTSRILAHHTSRGDEVPGTFADEEELTALAGVLRERGSGVFEVVPRGMDGEVSDAAHAELELMGRLAAHAGTRLTYSLVQTHTELDRWRLLLDRSAELRAQAVPIYPQVANRATGILFGLQSRNNVFCTRPSYRELAALPLEERLARMRDPETRARILAEPNGEWDHPLASFVYETFSNMLPVRQPMDWEPTPADTMAAIAERAGRPAQEVVYDFLTEGDGRNLVMFPFTNYFHFSLDDVHDMLEHPASVWGLGDGGAHCGAAVDASGPTLMLTHWVRDRVRGPRIDLPTAVRWMTSDTADLYGLHDRGRLLPGHRADLNVIDHEGLQVGQPEMVFDLPAGGRRLMQRASGYVATVVAGEVTLRDDAPTGAVPGRLIRGVQPAPV
jgi:N-acyl-D-aspartate/D-glutamate deacylase